DAVVAQRALLRRVRDRVDVDDAERARADAVAASVARVGLDHHRVELRPDDRSGGAHLQTPRLHAVLADIAHHQPPAVVRLIELLDELHVPPRGAAQPHGVVVAESTQLPGLFRGGKLIPVLAADLARLAPDADGSVGE